MVICLDVMNNLCHSGRESSSDPWFMLNEVIS